MTSFLRLVEDLLREPTERAAYLADPAGYLPARGFEDFDTADVEMSLQLTADALPPALAARLDPTEGLDTVVSVDIDELPGLWSQPDGADVTLDEMAEVDDPFLDDDGFDDAATVDHSAELDGAAEDAPGLDSVDITETAEGVMFDSDEPADGFPSLADELTAAPDVDPFDVDAGLDDPFVDAAEPPAEALDVEDVASFDDDVPFD